MKAIQVKKFGTPDEMQLTELDIPVPGSENVLIKVESIGVNPVDTYIREGKYPVLPELPYIPGKDVAGVIVEVGSDVKKWRVGDRVYSAGTITGGYCEYSLCHQSQIFSLPDNIDFAQGAAVGIPGAAAWRGLFTRARAKKDDAILIHGGSGSVGLIAIQLAVNAGLEVHATAGTSKGMEVMRRVGASHVFNHSQSGYLDEISAVSGDRGYDIILEMLANINLTHDLRLLAVRGRVVIIGSRGEITLDPRATMAKETEILGMSLFNSSEEEMKEAQVGLYQQMVSGMLTPEVSLVLPLERAGEAHIKILESGNCGKLVLKP